MKNEVIKMPASTELLTLPSNAHIERAEDSLLSAQRSGEIPFVDVPLVHRFSPGIYIREVTMTKDSFVIGHEHLTRHENIVLTGKALVSIGGEVELIEAPSVFVSEAGVRKILIIIETMRFLTVHPNPTNETNIDKLEQMFVRKSNSYLRHADEIAALKNAYLSQACVMKHSALRSPELSIASPS